jgi:hypothetical protein
MYRSKYVAIAFIRLTAILMGSAVGGNFIPICNSTTQNGMSTLKFEHKSAVFMHPVILCFIYYRISAVNETSNSRELLSFAVYKGSVFLSYNESAAKRGHKCNAKAFLGVSNSSILFQ